MHKRFLSISLLFAASAYYFANAELKRVDQYDIDPKNTAVFPAPPTEKVLAYKTSSLITHRNASGDFTDGFKLTRRVEKLEGSKIKVGWKFEAAKHIVKSNNAITRVEDEKVLPQARLAVTIDCATRTVIDRAIFDQEFQRIEKIKPEGPERDLLINNLRPLLESGKDACSASIGPFNLQKVVGQKPGFQWSEDSPITDLKNNKITVTFLGWAKRDGSVYAVLQGHLKTKGLHQDQGEKAELRLEITDDTIVSSDWKKVKKDVLTEQEVSAPGQPSISGKIKLISSSERVE